MRTKNRLLVAAMVSALTLTSLTAEILQTVIKLLQVHQAVQEHLQVQN